MASLCERHAFSRNSAEGAVTQMETRMVWHEDGGACQNAFSCS